MSLKQEKPTNLTLGDGNVRNKWYVPVLIFLLLILIYFFRGLFGSRVQYEVLREGTMEEMLSVKGLVIKYETLYETGSGGTVEAKVAGGSRVSKGMLLANIYSGAVDSEVMAKLDRVNKKIETIRESREEGLSFSGDVSKLDSEISSKVNAIIENGQKKKMSKVSELKTALSTLAERRATVSGQQSAGANTLEELEQTRQSLLGQVGTVQKKLISNSSGVFVPYRDGLESLITPYNMDVLTSDKLEELLETERKLRSGSKEDASVFACKVVDNFRYFVAFHAASSKLGDLKRGDSVLLRFNELSTESVSAEVYSVNAEENGQSTVICECNRFLDSLLEKRTVSMDFIRHRYKGYRVSVEALRTRDGVVGVYAKRDGVMRFLPVNILYNTQEIAIVSSADETKPLKLYDEIVVKAERFEEGAFVN